jgi:hypothetical protein
MSEVLTARNKNAFDPRTQPFTAILVPSAAAGETAKVMTDQLRRLASNLSPTLAQALSRPKKAPSVSEQLHDALGGAKILLSQVSMHLSKEWRDKLFRQLDALLDADSWDEADKVLDNGSFSTFLRMVLYQKLERRPALGISNRGHLLADWTVSGESLTVEFFPNDEVRWVLTHVVDGERESAAGQTQVGRLERVLAPYEPERWFANAPDEH